MTTLADRPATAPLTTGVVCVDRVTDSPAEAKAATGLMATPR